MRALETDKTYKAARYAVTSGARRFPPALELQVSISECDISDKRLRHRERIWIPHYEPLRTKLMQLTHNSALGGHPG